MRKPLRLPRPAQPGFPTSPRPKPDQNSPAGKRLPAPRPGVDPDNAAIPCTFGRKKVEGTMIGIVNGGPVSDQDALDYPASLG